MSLQLRSRDISRPERELQLGIVTVDEGGGREEGSILRVVE